MSDSIIDNEPSRRYPIYTRGNVGEVFPDPVAPLTWTLLGIPGAEAGWRDALERFGAFDRAEFSPHQIEIMGIFGSYCYLNVSISRIFGVRTPGLRPEVVDRAFFGEQADVRPYDPQPGDESPAHSARIGATLGRVLAAAALPELDEDRREVDELIRSRPDLRGLSDEELVERVREILPERFRRFFARHIYVLYGCFVGVGLLATIADHLGDAELVARLVAGIGGVDSADPAFALWELGRFVDGSPELSKAFDSGMAGLLDRLRASETEDSDGFLRAFDAFVSEFGSRGPNEWEMRSPTWETHPELALLAVDRMRLSLGQTSPRALQETLAAERENLIASVAHQLAGNAELQGQFLAAARSAAVFLAGRERSKTTVVKLIHEGRLTMRELGRRMVAAGHFERPENFGMLTSDELDAFVNHPSSLVAVVRDRERRSAELAELVPPFIIDGVVPPVATWPRRTDTGAGAVPPKSVLSGIPGSPGQASGRARVLTDPFDAGHLQPGEVLVVPIINPSWTPLFLVASAVVVDVGSQTSHAVIVARELGVPCVVSVADATTRIPTGAVVSVDGGAGTVLIH